MPTALNVDTLAYNRYMQSNQVLAYIFFMELPQLQYIWLFILFYNFHIVNFSLSTIELQVSMEIVKSRYYFPHIDTHLDHVS